MFDRYKIIPVTKDLHDRLQLIKNLVALGRCNRESGNNEGLAIHEIKQYNTLSEVGHSRGRGRKWTVRFRIDRGIQKVWIECKELHAKSMELCVGAR